MTLLQLSPLQLSVYWRLSLIIFFSSFLFFLDIFTNPINQEKCGSPTNFSDLQDFDGTHQGWMTEDSANQCSSWLTHGQMMFMVGLLLGSLLCGPFSDRYGRRPVLLVCVVIHAVCGVLPAIFHDPLFYLAVRCLTGICSCCINISCFSLAVEWTLAPSRLWPPAFLPFCFSLGTMGGSALAWTSNTWTQLHLMMSLPQLICLPLFFFIPESPRWLMLFQKADELKRYRDNSLADNRCLDLLLESSTDPKSATEATTGDTMQLKHPMVLLRLSIMSFLSLASSITYNGISMNVGSFGVGVYSAHFFSGLSETPCLLVPLLHLGRRTNTMLALLLSGCASFLSLLLSRFQGGGVLVMSLALFGKLCVLAAIFVSNVYGIELFPTVIRQRCLSVVNLSYRIGCLINSAVPATSGGAISLGAMLLYSSGPIIGCGLCLLLPETAGAPLPDTVEDCKQQRQQLPLVDTNDSKHLQKHNGGSDSGI
ncbi:solute carrier family 22 member 6 [Synchiropus splendidus]|uniref:solute carrier family 22 member 6 n=1 Tax=Synchiropus splendidus TaxID=270530 RepID=UPI00237D66F3|nr:solute carrier family 22 member 6 [Synchiropus splendidus]